MRNTLFVTKHALKKAICDLEVRSLERDRQMTVMGMAVGGCAAGALLGIGFASARAGKGLRSAKQVAEDLEVLKSSSNDAFSVTEDAINELTDRVEALEAAQTNP